MNLISRWVKAIVTLALLTLLSSAAWFYHIQQQAIREKVEEDLAVVARLKVDQIAAWRKDKLSDAAAMQENPFLIQSVERYLTDPNDANGQDLLAHFRILAQQHDCVDLLLADPHGKDRLSLSGSIQRHDRPALALTTALRESKPIFIDIHTETQESTPHISVAVPLFTATGQSRKPLGGVILVSNASQFLYPLVQSWPTPSKTAETLLVRREGDYALFLNDLRHQAGTALKLRIPLSRTDVPAVMAVMGQQGVFTGKDYRGTEVVSVILPIPDSPWFMVTKVDAAEVFAEWHFRSVLMIALLLGFTMFLGVVGLVLWQREKKDYYRKLYFSEAALRENVQRHSITLKAIGDAVIATDARGLVELLNPVAETLTGWMDDEARGRPLEEVFRIVNEETHEKVESPVAKVLREGIVVGLANHTLLIARDGTLRPVADSGAPIRDDQDEITGVVLVFRDQTAERAAAAELAERERYYRTLLFNLHESILVIDRDYCITDINNTALQSLGLRRTEVLGRKCHKISHGQNSPCHGHGQRCELAEVFETGNPCNCLHEHIDSNGTRVYVDILMSPYKNEDGKVTHVIEAARDVTELHQAQATVLENEEKFRAIFEHMALGCCLDEIVYNDGKAVDYRILDVNPAYERFIGIGKARAVGALASNLYGMGQAPNIDIYARVIETGEQASFETFFPPTQRHLHVTVSQLAPGRFCTIFQDISERKQAEVERERLLSAIEQAGEMILITDPVGVIQYVNPEFERATGYCRKEAIGQNPRILKSGKQDRAFYQNMWETITRGGIWEGRMVNMRKDGTLFTEVATISSVRDPSGQILNYVAVKRDITEYLRLQAQFQQAQKMESVGRLAGGVAHDYNNMLSVIIGYAEMALEQVDQDKPLYADLMEIFKAAKRSTAITQQLLAFARKQTISPQVLDLNQTVESMLNMLRRLIGEDIDFLWKPGGSCGPVKMDPSQIDQILANLCVNARDAIDGVGKVTIETGKASFDEAYCAEHNGLIPGEYALLAVSDDGCGMDKEIMDNIFEPFFTTKTVGQGTGLGLATVYGIVKQNNGFVNVYSEPGNGTTFRIYLPHHAGQTERVEAQSMAQIAPSRGETVLIVEDEQAILEMGKMMLEKLGYRVLAANTPSEAVRITSEHAGKITLLITDVVMPEMNGRELAQKLHTFCPDMKTLFMSGYTANVIAHRGVLEEGVNFIQKPFSKQGLATKIRDVLDKQSYEKDS